MTDQLTAHGWKQTPSGRWIHPDAPPLGQRRRRLFTEAEALTLLSAEPDHDEDDLEPTDVNAVMA